jgi:hypothetical protein
VGPPQEVSRVVGGAGIKYQEFADGWIYEVYSPVGCPSAVLRGKTIKILLLGRWIGAFSEDGVNYMSVWIPREEHEELFPYGPPTFRVYDEEGVETARSRVAAWQDPNETNPSLKTGPIKLVELAKLQGPQKGPESA